MARNLHHVLLAELWQSAPLEFCQPSEGAASHRAFGPLGGFISDLPKSGKCAIL